MAVILVVERDPNDAQIISDSLRSEGWSVEVADGADAALRSASADAPRLVLVAAGLADTNEIVTAFARRRGGPGVIVLRGSGEMMPTDADAWLQKPVFVDELRETVRDQLRAASLPGQESRAERAASSKPLTSADIFADVLAEVEAEVGWPPALGAQKSPAAVPPSRPPLQSQPQPQPQPQPRLPPQPQPPPQPPAPAPQP
ncbi:MAG: hypothetical protein HC897_01795, partial [Thermoanaerobaculia bacterium]|nr:hypothetical protein [Thermoanaerobaculia bacterium]